SRIYRLSSYLFFFTYPATTQLYTLSLHDALPISSHEVRDNPTHFHKTNDCYVKYNKDLRKIFNVSEWFKAVKDMICGTKSYPSRSEEHTSELQSRGHLVCRLLLEKKKKIKNKKRQ